MRSLCSTVCMPHSPRGAITEVVRTDAVAPPAGRLRGCSVIFTQETEETVSESARRFEFKQERSPARWTRCVALKAGT